MILRSIRLVNFRGVGELHLRDLPPAGVVSPELPAGAERDAVTSAIRFAFLGGAFDDVLSARAGHAFVEVVFHAGDHRDVSIFRGVDRRGSLQVSLREDGGARMTGGAEEVAARLVELVGMPLDRWERATWIELPAVGHAPPRDATAAVDDASFAVFLDRSFLEDDAALAEIVRRVAPGVSQVFAPRPVRLADELRVAAADDPDAARRRR